MIHPTALVDPKAEIGENVDIGPFSVVEKGVSIGEGTKIGPHVVVRGGTQIGKRCQIYQFSSIGEAPQATAYRGEPTLLQVGDHNVIREYVTLHRGSVKGGGKTVLGNENFIMAYSHVAHDCQIGNHVVMANVATLGGHILIEDHAIIGGLVAIHQFCRIGTYAMVSGFTGVAQDVPPYTMAAGDRARLYGLNSVGLKRHQFSQQEIKALKKAYRIIFRSGLALEKALKTVEGDDIFKLPKVQHLLEFIRHSKRGICR